MNDSKQDNTIAIIGIVLGGLGFLISFVPCIGFLGMVPGVIGLILGIIGYFKAKDNGDKRTLSVVAMVVSILPFLISGFYFLFMTSVVGDLNSEVEVYSDCPTLEADMKTVELQIDSLETVIESGDNVSSALAVMGTLTKLAVRLSKMQEQAAGMNCDFQIRNIKVEKVPGSKIEVDIESERTPAVDKDSIPRNNNEE